ncbi:hypothetical protein EDD11_001667 [Mortierella claussenii]|nr:hypothetical protein EDD11_001667 [Mortierella claussenii]
MALDDLDFISSAGTKSESISSLLSDPEHHSKVVSATSIKTGQELSFQDIETKFLDPTLDYPQPILDFRDLYRRLHHSTNPVDREEVLRVYRSLADDPEMLRWLQPLDFMIVMNSCRNLLHTIPRMHKILFDDASKTEHRDVVELYNILLKAYVKLSDYKSCSNVVDKMRRNKNIQFNNQATYHILLNICRHERRLKDAQGILNQMRRNKVEVNDWTYLVMLSVCMRCKNATMAREYFNEMPLMGMDHSVLHYNALLNTYAQARDLNGARDLFNMMEEEGIQPDQYTYLALIKAYKSAKRLPEAMEWIEQLKSRDGVKLNAKVLSALGKEPLEIVDQCTRDGVDLDENDFAMLIIRALKSNQFAHVATLMQEMHSRGHRPNVYTFTAMVDANIKMDKYQDAKDIFRAMQQANVQPDVIAYSALISGALSKASVQESMEILKEMVNDSLLPNLHTFNSLLSASVGEIGISGFKIIRETMEGLHIRPDHRSFNALLSAYALNGDMDEMLGALDDMRASHVRPDALTYSILIAGFLQNGDLRYAMEWYYKMIEGGHRPATFMFNNLMAALHMSGEGQRVMMLWHEMGRLRVKKNSRTFETVLETCEKYGMDDARVQVEEQLKLYLAGRVQVSASETVGR